MGKSKRKLMEFTACAAVFWLFLLISCRSPQKTPPAEKQPLRWAEGIVWYQIFPERYRNGLKKDDPTQAEVPEAAGNPHWQIHPWTSDWYKLQPWEREVSSNFYDARVVFARRYGGDLIGVLEKLDYLKDLGIDAIYFNPLFEAPSLHKYDGSTFHHIDDNFGPDPAEDKRRLAAAGETEDPNTWIWTTADSLFLRLVKEAHRRGIRIVIDGVFNHTGTRFFAFRDILKNGKNSRYADWYEITSWDDPSTPKNEFDYKGWWGIKSLPEFAEDKNGLVSGPRKYVFAITRRWMDPNGDGDPSDGVDGWRLDVAEEIAPPFWRDWYRLVKSINPKAITVAEIWGNASQWIADGRMDGTMNYLFAKATVAYFIDRKKAISADSFADRMEKILSDYGPDVALRLWNLMDSHDTDRLASMIVNPDRKYDSQNSPRYNPNYDVRKPNSWERKIQKQILVFQMTFPGAPVIYYGDEAGMWGADDPDDRKPMVWPDLRFEVERSDPVPGKTRPPDPNGFDAKLFQFYRKMIRLHHEHPALMHGEFRFLRDSFSKNLLVFVRKAPEEEILCIFNRGAQKETATIRQKNLQYSRYKDLLSGRILNRQPVTGLAVDVDGRGFRILKGM